MTQMNNLVRDHFLPKISFFCWTAWLCGLLTTPQPSNAEQSDITAAMVQTQVAAIDARLRSKKPFLKRDWEEGERGSEAVAWGGANAIEKISFKHLGERGELWRDFYWRQGVLIAVRTRQFDYGGYLAELPQDKPVRRKLQIDEKIEFAGETLLRWRSSGRQLVVRKAVATEEAERLQADARTYKLLMSIPDTKASKTYECRWECESHVSEPHPECMAWRCK
jgi:hypothetical protein